MSLVTAPKRICGRLRRVMRPSVPGDLVPAIPCLGKTDHLARCFRKPWYDSVVGTFPELTSHQVGCMSNVIS